MDDGIEVVIEVDQQSGLGCNSEAELLSGSNTLVESLESGPEEEYCCPEGDM